MDDLDPFDALAESHHGPPPRRRINAAAKVCGRCPLAEACPVRVRPKPNPRKRRADGGPPRRSGTTAKKVVINFLRTSGETTAPLIRDATDLTLSSIRSAIHDLTAEGRIHRRPAPPGGGNRVYLSLIEAKG